MSRSGEFGSHPVWPRDSFGPTLTLARKYFGPEYFGPEYFGPEYFGPEILRSETTSAERILQPTYILSKVSFFIIFDLP